jgi:hypothetical protein
MTRWEIDKITGLTDEAEKARDYLMKLPAGHDTFQKKLFSGYILMRANYSDCV